MKVQLLGIVAAHVAHLNSAVPHYTMVVALFASLGLGMVHGTVPDEHTWPITFSYSVGSYSQKGGRRVGLVFSAAFTLQRAIAAELAYFALSSFEKAVRWNYIVYVVIGTVMAGSALYLSRRYKHKIQTSTLSSDDSEQVSPSLPPYRLALMHGFLAGWGIGAFATLLYGVFVPSMPNAYLGWLPGFLFGVGTMILQVLFGGLIGRRMEKAKFSLAGRAYLGSTVGRRVLWGSGLSFFIVGLIGLVFPNELNRLSIATHIPVGNLSQFDVGMFLAVVALGGVAIWAFRKTLKEMHLNPSLVGSTQL